MIQRKKSAEDPATRTHDSRRRMRRRDWWRCLWRRRRCSRRGWRRHGRLGAAGGAPLGPLAGCCRLSRRCWRFTSATALLLRRRAAGLCARRAFAWRRGACWFRPDRAWRDARGRHHPGQGHRRRARRLLPADGYLPKGYPHGVADGRGPHRLRDDELREAAVHCGAMGAASQHSRRRSCTPAPDSQAQTTRRGWLLPPADAGSTKPQRAVIGEGRRSPRPGSSATRA